MLLQKKDQAGWVWRSLERTSPVTITGLSVSTSNRIKDHNFFYFLSSLFSVHGLNVEER